MKNFLAVPVRRIVSLALFVAFSVASVEAVAGETRDGEVHHENVGDATMHHNAMGLRGDHGHEDSVPPADQDHGPQHQHGTSADHCTHFHGVGLTATTAVLLASAVTTASSFQELDSHTDRCTQAPTQPPKS